MAQETASIELTVASVQFRSTTSLKDNLARTRTHLKALRAQGVRVAAFPECAATAYSQAAIEALTADELEAAEAELAAMCREVGMYMVMGLPYFENGERYNGALVWDPDGKCIARYAKVQLAGEKWCVPGERLVLFEVDDVVCSVIVCHDERYPELVRLPVMAGAQLVFYISCESDATQESKLDPYRAQIQARAMENSIYIVQSNTPQGLHDDGMPISRPGYSHGQSRIIQPDGNLICEATIYQEEVLTATLDMNEATRGLAKRSLGCGLLGDWWQSGVKLVSTASGQEH